MKKIFLLIYFITTGLVFSKTPVDRLLVVNKDEGTVWTINVSDGKVIAKIDVDDGPHEIASSPDGKTAVVGNYFWKGSPKNTLKVIDVASNKITKTIDLSPYHAPHGIQFLPNGKEVIVTAERQNKLLVVNIETGKITKEIDNKGGSHMVMLNESSDKAYGTAIPTGLLNIVDMNNPEKQTFIATGQGTEALAVRPNSNEIWVGNNNENNVKIIDAESQKIIKTFDWGIMPIRINFTRDGKYAIVSRYIIGDLGIYDADEKEFVAEVDLGFYKTDRSTFLNSDKDKQDEIVNRVVNDGARPLGCIVDPDNKYLYVSVRGQKQIAKVEIGSWKVIETIQTGNGPDGITYSRIIE